MSDDQKNINCNFSGNTDISDMIFRYSRRNAVWKLMIIYIKYNTFIKSSQKKMNKKEIKH